MRGQSTHRNIILGQSSKGILREMGRTVVTKENSPRVRQFGVFSDGFDPLDENPVDRVIKISWDIYDESFCLIAKASRSRYPCSHTVIS
jgi:hypothetical protein